MADNYTPLFSEILTRLGKIKSKKDKVTFLKQHNTDALRMIIKSSFDPNVKWALPYGEVPFIPNDAPEGTEHNVLSYEARKLYHFIDLKLSFWLSQILLWLKLQTCTIYLNFLIVEQRRCYQWFLLF